MLFKLLRKLFNKHVNTLIIEALLIAFFLTLFGLNWNDLIQELLNRFGIDTPSWFIK